MYTYDVQMDVLDTRALPLSEILQTVFSSDSRLVLYIADDFRVYVYSVYRKQFVQSFADKAPARTVRCKFTGETLTISPWRGPAERFQIVDAGVQGVLVVLAAPEQTCVNASIGQKSGDGAILVRVLKWMLVA